MFKLQTDGCLIRPARDVYPSYYNQREYGLGTEKTWPQINEMWCITIQPGYQASFYVSKPHGTTRHSYVVLYESIVSKPLLKKVFGIGQPGSWGPMRNPSKTDAIHPVLFAGINEGGDDDFAYMKPVGDMCLGVDDRGDINGPDWDDLVIDIGSGKITE